MDDFLTPDGIFRIQFMRFEMRMSHWVNNPRLTHIPSGEVLLDCWNTMDDASPSMDEQGRLHLFMRTYPGSSPGREVIYDPAEGTVTYVDRDRSETFIHDVLIKHATRPRRTPPAPAAIPSPRPAASVEPPPTASLVASADQPAAIQTATLPRWRALLYNFVFWISLPTLLIAAWLGGRATASRRFHHMVALGLAQILIIVALIAAGALLVT